MYHEMLTVSFNVDWITVLMITVK